MSKQPPQAPIAEPGTEALPGDRAPALPDAGNDADAKHLADLELPHFGLTMQTQPRPGGAQADMFGAAGLDRKPAGNLRHGGGTLL